MLQLLPPIDVVPQDVERFAPPEVRKRLALARIDKPGNDMDHALIRGLVELETLVLRLQAHVAEMDQTSKGRNPIGPLACILYRASIAAGFTKELPERIRALLPPGPT